MVVTTKILPRTLLDKIKQSKPLYAMARKTRFRIGSLLGSRQVPNIPGRCHYNDFMLTSVSEEDVRAYYGGALSFVGILEQALSSVGREWSDLDGVLDVGCGYGRIVRVLKNKVLASKISVTDVIEEGAIFTAAEFGVKQIPPLERINDNCAYTFDLVYLLSVYTHLTDDSIKRNLSVIARLLKHGGILVFTTHGFVSARAAERYEHFWLRKQSILDSLEKKGYYFSQYPHYRDVYGMTWVTENFMKDLVSSVDPRLKFVSYKPGELDGHQDVFVFQKE